MISKITFNLALALILNLTFNNMLEVARWKGEEIEKQEIWNFFSCLCMS